MTSQLIKLITTLAPGVVQHVFSDQDKNRAIRTLEDDMGYLFHLQKKSRKREMILGTIVFVLVAWNVVISVYLIALIRG